MEKPQKEHPKGVRLISAKHNSFRQLVHLAVTSIGLPTTAVLAFRFRQWRFLKSTNFQSKLVVRALMWSTKSRTRRSS
jgi:hypothetical protein